MKPFALNEIKTFGIDTSDRSITFEMPREGGRNAQLKIGLDEVPRFMTLLLGATQQASVHLGDPPPLPESTPATGIRWKPSAVDVRREPGMDGYLVFRQGHVDLHVHIDRMGMEAICQALNRTSR